MEDLLELSRYVMQYVGIEERLIDPLRNLKLKNFKREKLEYYTANINFLNVGFYIRQEGLLIVFNPYLITNMSIASPRS